MAGYFEIKAALNGQFMFNLKAGNHEVILTSVLYANKADCIAGIDAVRKHAPDDANFLRRKAKDGADYFVLTAPSHLTLGRSEMYSSAAAMETGIASVKTSAPGTPLRNFC